MSTRSTKGSPARFGPKEREFVRDAYPALGPAVIAKKLGRSKSGVCALIARMKEAGEIRPPESTERSRGDPECGPPPGDNDDGTQDTLGRLRRARAVLERSLYDAEPTQVGRVAAEYRATLMEIDRLERLEGTDGEDVLDDLAEALLRKAR